jgi:GNAT superfamily N-acetyltransferase
MPTTVTFASQSRILPLRARHRLEMNNQIVHDSIHRREGWTLSYEIQVDEQPVGFGSVAIAGPWKDKPTIFEYYLLPEFLPLAFSLFEAFLKASQARFFEVQTNETLLANMLHAYATITESEKIVFQDCQITGLPSNGTVLKSTTSPEELKIAIEQRQGGGEWILESDNQTVGKGGILFHYNRPYGDIYMDIPEQHRRKGYGSYLVQELKRECYQLGAIPAARCSPTNTASRSTLTKAGFAPCAHILLGELKRE